MYAELVNRVVFRVFHVGRLRPARPGPREEIDGAGLLRGVIVLLAVDSLRGAVLELCGNRQRVAVAADLQPGAEPVFLAGVRRLDERLLRPLRALADEYHDRPDRRV